MDHLGVNVQEWLNDEKAKVFSLEDKHSCVDGFNEELQGDIDVDINLDDL